MTEAAYPAAYLLARLVAWLTTKTPTSASAGLVRVDSIRRQKDDKQ